MNLLSNNKNNGCILLLASIFAVCSGIMPIYGQNNKQKKDLRHYAYIRPKQ